MDLLTNALNRKGVSADEHKGRINLYVTDHKSANVDEVNNEFDSGEAFSEWLITNELISTVPWDDCGNFVRFSVTFAAKGVAKEKEIVDDIAQRLAKYQFIF